MDRLPQYLRNIIKDLDPFISNCLANSTLKVEILSISSLVIIIISSTYNERTIQPELVWLTNRAEL